MGIALVEKLKKKRAEKKARKCAVSTVEEQVRKISKSRPPTEIKRAPAKTPTADAVTPCGIYPAPTESSVAAAERHMQTDQLRAQLAQVHQAAAATASALLRRGEGLDKLVERSLRLHDVSNTFTTSASSMKRQLMWKNAKFYVVTFGVLSMVALGAVAYYGHKDGRLPTALVKRAGPGEGTINIPAPAPAMADIGTNPEPDSSKHNSPQIDRQHLEKLSRDLRQVADSINLHQRDKGQGPVVNGIKVANLDM